VAQTAVDIVVKVAGGQKLKQLDSALKGTASSAVKASTGLDKAGRSAKKAGQEAQRAQGKFSRLSGVVGKLAVAFAGLQLGRFIISSTAQFERIDKQLTTVTGSAETARKVFKELDQVNKQSPFELTELTSAAAKLSAFGVENDKLVDTTRRLGLVAAATQQEISGIALAYGQVRAKGRLQGEELLQFVERGVPLQKELQRMLGLTGEEFADAMRKGKIGVELVDKAVENLTDETGQFGKAFENTSGTIDNKLSNMRDQFAKTAAALGKAFEPQFKFLIDSITTVAKYFEDVFKRISRGQKGLAAEQAAQVKATQFTRDRFGAVRTAAAGITGDQEVLDFRQKAQASALQNELAKVDRELAELRGEISKPALPKAPKPSASEIQTNRDLLLGNDDKGTGTGTGTGISGNEFAKFLKDQEKQLANSQELLGNAEAANQLAKVKNDLEQINIQFAKDVSDVLLKNQKLYDAALSTEEEANILKGRSLELDTLALEKQEAIAELRGSAVSGIEDEIQALEAKAAGLEDIYVRQNAIAELVKAGQGTVTESEAASLVNRKQELENLVAKQQELKDTAMEVAGTISSAFTSAFESVVNGSRTAQEALSDAFKSIGESFIDMALSIIQQQMAMIINGLIMKALGVTMPGAGAVPTGFDGSAQGLLSVGGSIPGFADGGMLPSYGPAIVGENGPELVMSRGGQTHVYSNQESRQMVDTRDVMDRYSRPNSVAPEAAFPIKFESTVINGQEFVTRQEAEEIGSRAAKQGAAAGAKAGEARVLGRLKNQRSTRKTLGL
jgi:tape measure domain-containing protein